MRLRGRRPPVPVWWPLPACAALGLTAGAAYGALAEPEYASTTYLIAVAEKDSEPAATLGFAQAYGRLATSTSTLAYAQGNAGVPTRQLGSRVQTETSPESPMIGITGTAGRPGDAADIANAVADALRLKANGQSENTGVKLVRFSQAVKVPDPVSPSLPLSIAVGTSAGALVGGLILLVRPRRTPAYESPVLPAPAGEPATTRDPAPAPTPVTVKVTAPAPTPVTVKATAPAATTTARAKKPRKKQENQSS
ncbi:lipopolysaccharide biosynthesis protein [Streptomyces sp. B-S-A12]|uniref:Lipopolysaccharide biosynthesis protein n=1 Tax=Streptomyces luteolus TaxID=3043615 RepID=A0ABT6SWS2_9ACTN|nr:lipopolysaccharide biosynthesis protein [Streptomyces sp. B-S-A12]MDI3419112.1 lipopolysaccharide biosynthesis protein [Streptomyces sp. B-S-A12]